MRPSQVLPSKLEEATSATEGQGGREEVLSIDFTRFWGELKCLIMGIFARVSKDAARL